MLWRMSGTESDQLRPQGVENIVQWKALPQLEQRNSYFSRIVTPQLSDGGTAARHHWSRNIRLPVGNSGFPQIFHSIAPSFYFNRKMTVEDSFKHQVEMAENAEKGEARQHQDVC